jgi:glutathione S-transferase
MYTLYWSAQSAALAPHAVLEEAGAPYQIRQVDLSTEPRDPAYLVLNPSGKVPTLVIEGRQGLTESAAIVMHLCDRHPEAGLAPAAGEPARGAWYQWLVHLTNTLQPAYLRWYYPDRHTTLSSGHAEIKAQARRELETLWQRIDGHLEAHGPYLLGARYSAADIFALMLASWKQAVPDLLERCPQVHRCVSLVAERPAIRRTLAQHGLAG